MKENLCEQLARVIALVRERIVGWSGYRGQGRRPQFVDDVVKLALYVSKHQRRNPGSFPCCRMALKQRIDVPEHVIRSGIKCLVEIGLLVHDGDLVRKPRSVRYAPRQFILADVVRAIFNPSRQDLDSPPKKEERREEAIKPPLYLLAGRAARDAVKEANKAFLRSLFPGDDAAWEAHWRSLPGR